MCAENINPAKTFRLHHTVGKNKLFDEQVSIYSAGLQSTSRTVLYCEINEILGKQKSSKTKHRYVLWWMQVPLECFCQFFFIKDKFSRNTDYDCGHLTELRRSQRQWFINFNNINENRHNLIIQRTLIREGLKFVDRRCSKLSFAPSEKGEPFASCRSFLFPLGLFWCDY